MIARRLLHSVKVGIPLGAILIWTSMLVSGQSGVKNGEWPHWGGDLGNTQILTARSNQPRQREDAARGVAMEG